MQEISLCMIRKTAVGVVSFLLLILSLSANAQSGFISESIWRNINPSTGEAGDFIITKSGVKVFGKVISKYDEATYRTVVFANDGVETTYSPNDLQAFGLTNSRFFLTKTLPGESDPKFVQILLSGELQLNFYDNRYFLDNGDEILELRAFYTQGQIDGNKLKRYVKAYISTLKIQMAGDCGTQLNDLIENTKMEELDFIRLFSKYHECSGLPYKVHVSNVKFLKVSPVVMAGLGSASIYNRSVETGQANDLDGKMNQRLQVGIRLHDFRKLPRLSIDFRVGVELLNSNFVSSFERPGVVRISASEEFSETNVFIPLSFNYSVFRRQNLDVYAGFITSVWFSTIKSKGAMIEEQFLNSDRTNLYEDSFLVGVDRLFVPGLKLGAKFPVGKMVIFSELQGDLQLDYYTTNILAKRSSFSRSGVSFQIGIEF